MDPLYKDDIWAFSKNKEHEHIEELTKAIIEARRIIELAVNDSKDNRRSPDWLKDGEMFLEVVVLDDGSE